MAAMHAHFIGLARRDRRAGALPALAVLRPGDDRARAAGGRRPRSRSPSRTRAGGCCPSARRGCTPSSPTCTPIPDALSDALRTTPQTFVGGDWKLGNVGRRPDGRTVLVDQAYPGEAASVLGPHLVPGAQPRAPAGEQGGHDRAVPRPARGARRGDRGLVGPTARAQHASAWPRCSPGRRPWVTRSSSTGGSGWRSTGRAGCDPGTPVSPRRGPPTRPWSTVRWRSTSSTGPRSAWTEPLRSTPEPGRGWPATCSGPGVRAWWPPTGSTTWRRTACVRRSPPT